MSLHDFLGTVALGGGMALIFGTLCADDTTRRLSLGLQTWGGWAFLIGGIGWFFTRVTT